MSLLMDALKQAEQNKVKDKQAVTEAVQSAERAAGEDVPAIASTVAEDIEDEPVAPELDFSEIEATIAAENRMADPDPPDGEAVLLDSTNDVPASDKQTDPAAQFIDERSSITASKLSIQGAGKTFPSNGDSQSFREPATACADQAHHADTRAVANTPADAARILAASRRRENMARKRQFLMLGILAVVVLLLVVAYYFWALGLNVQTVALSGAIEPVALIDAPQQQDATKDVAVIPGKITPVADEPIRLKNPGNTRPPALPVAVPQTKVDKVSRQKLPKDTVSPEKKPADMSFQRHTDTPSVYQMLSMAYQAYQENRILDARRHYQQVLTRQPRNRDALLGLASVAVRQGRNEEAQSLYRRQLELDPRDGAAQTGLLSLLSTGDPVANESLIKQMLREHGETAYLRFALGNVYAAQSRWEEAQRSYFRAYSAAPQNANYLFNLAVSLDHLHQDRMALQYYRWAVDMAAGQVIKFAIEAAQQRIRALSSSDTVGQS